MIGEAPEVQLSRSPEREWVKIRKINILYFHFEVQDSFVFPLNYLSRPRYFDQPMLLGESVKKENLLVNCHLDIFLLI